MNNKFPSSQFWLKEAKSLTWQKFPKLCFIKKKNNYFKWFSDGKISLYENIFKKENENKIAIYYYDLNEKK